MDQAAPPPCTIAGPAPPETCLLPKQELSPIARPYLLPPQVSDLNPGVPQAVSDNPLYTEALIASAALKTSPSVDAFIKSRQHKTFQAPLPGSHPAAALLQSYATDGFPAEVGAAWPMASILAAVAAGPHTSTMKPAATTFCRTDLLDRVRRGFSIILTLDDALAYFGTRLRISRLASVDQPNRKPRLICDSSAAPDDSTPSVNASTIQTSNPNAIQFGSCLARLVQKIWEADPEEGPVLLSKWDVSDAFPRCPLRPSHVGAFAYVVPPVDKDPSTLLCIDLVLPMGWVSSPDLFCATSETTADIANAYCLDPSTPFCQYAPTKGVYHTTDSPPASPSRLQHTDVYMDDFISLTQGDPSQQTRVSELVLRAIKETYPSLPGEVKDSVSLKKARQDDGDWESTKEILGWIINAQDGTLRLSPKRRADLESLLDIPPSQRRMSRKHLMHLIGKLRSMHLAVPGAIGHFYYMQMALTKANTRTAYLSNGFHQEVCYWHALLKEMDMRPTFLASIVKRSPTDLGFTDASGIGGGGVWLDPNSDGASYMWRLLWPEDIAKDLVSLRNPHGRITNSDLELAALVLHEAIPP